MSNLQRLMWAGNVVSDDEEEDVTEHEPSWTPHFYDSSSKGATTYIPLSLVNQTAFYNPITIPYDSFVRDTWDKIYNPQRRPPHALDIGHMLVHLYSAPGSITTANEIPDESLDSIVGELLQKGSIDDPDVALDILIDALNNAAEDINENKWRQQQAMQTPVRRV